MDLNKLARKCKKISNKRLKNGARINPDTLKHASGEILEAYEARNIFYSTMSEKDKKALGDELMDIVFCVFVECEKNGVNVEKALKENVKKNKLRAQNRGDKK